MHSPKLLLTTALCSEATPLIPLFKLKKLHSVHAFNLYQSNLYDITLIETGIGKINAAAAVGFAMGLLACPQHTCICNLGIAGGHQPLGSIWLVHKVTDYSTGQSYYPSPQSGKLASTTLISHEQPQQHYPNTALVDMEGAAFYHAANRHVNTEQISLLKIVSDNDNQSRQALNASQVSGLIEQQLPAIEQHCQHLIELSQSESAHTPPLRYAQGIAETITLTHYQQHQMFSLLRRWETVFPDNNPLELTPSRDPRQLMDCMRHKLLAASYFWE